MESFCVLSNILYMIPLRKLTLDFVYAELKNRILKYWFELKYFLYF